MWVPQERNPGPLEGQQVLIITKLSLVPAFVTRSQVAQDGPAFRIQYVAEEILVIWSFCLHFPSAGTTSLYATIPGLGGARAKNPGLGTG